MHPRPAPRAADEERVVILDRQVVDRVPAKGGTRPRCQLLRFVFLPREAHHLQRQTRPADDACPNAQAARFHPALPLHVQRMLRRAGQSLCLARPGIVRCDINHRRRMALNRCRLRLFLAGLRVAREYLIANLDVTDQLCRPVRYLNRCSLCEGRTTLIL